MSNNSEVFERKGLFYKDYIITDRKCYQLICGVFSSEATLQLEMSVSLSVCPSVREPLIGGNVIFSAPN